MDKKINIKIGQKVRLLRQARSLSLNELSRLSGISKAALSKLESGDSNPRIDTLEAIAIALRFPLSDLFTLQHEAYPYLVKSTPMQGDYTQQFKFRINMGNISEIWQLNMKRGAVINSPAHMSGTHEHIMLHTGSLMLRLKNEQTVLLEEGDFYAFSCDFPHSYLCMEGELNATVVMTYSHLSDGI
ncbi:helix-turn-helix domain-containing protein [Providencia stuartii]|uniref:Helix-turn-helix domain-containing protein n=2 Tax=Providencia TaxID=586 RepID=A0AAI9DDS5_PROST|nr:MULTISPECIES: helix-turn-helix transcriptional regulator [Providencia]MDV5227017.1 helix-turn-helix domain-containing protein [Providencia rettgeri]ELR5039615.1 helix-turn-helix domain-containing protein [Providencia stuartii]ELR5082257.1 helix-turn-helix domain-containing protein [Providencia stuartii]ELR5113721.1 helix-turn-helix domain-containing protein [Providencia stuartii]ELR5301041.1 helix-turn-helix domain-containing protein [Providencia stuartii]